jgi:RNA polymerase sigma-70 factor (ECF subfamily)
MDWFRANKKKAAYEFMEQIEVSQLETTEDQLLRKELQQDVWKALNTLSEANRIVTILFYIDNYKVREIADFLDLSIEAVESRLRRSRTILKREMLSTVNNNLSENKLQDEFKKRVFQDERMPETNFRRVAMGQSEFDDIDMPKTNFSNVNMAGTKFDNINMSSTTFNDINMHLVKFNEVGLWEIEVSNSELGEAYFHDIHLYGKGNKFERCQLNGTSFVECDLSNVEIKDCNLSGVTVNGISLEALLESYHKNK